MRGGRARIGFERLGEGLDRAGIVHRVDAAPAETEVRFFLLVQLALLRRQTAAGRDENRHRQRIQTESAQ